MDASEHERSALLERLERRRNDFAGQPEVASLLGLPVLVVDDNATNRRIPKFMLQEWQMRPTLADGGHAGLAALRRAKEAG